MDPHGASLPAPGSRQRGPEEQDAKAILGDSRQGIWGKIATTVVVDDPDGRLVA
ncbi:MAG: hypothetical protein KY438_04735 [Actinobacteria bacterium]|nr:hypothetical protein [Actinomycetota bacterium]